jgi:hypothetical protein
VLALLDRVLEWLADAFYDPAVFWGLPVLVELGRTALRRWRGPDQRRR